jgi:hypothetical protein
MRDASGFAYRMHRPQRTLDSAASWPRLQDETINVGISAKQVFEQFDSFYAVLERKRGNPR